MYYRKISFIFTISLLQFVQAQKTKVDTVYVYEKVIVYDTIYLDKAIKNKLIGINLNFPTLHELSIQNRTFKIADENEIKKNSFSLKFHYGIEAGVGLKKSVWVKELSDGKQQLGQNFGIWISKNIVTPNLSLMLTANVYYWNSTLDLDANKEDTLLNGFYFTENRQPLLFQKFNNKHFEYTAQLKILYEWKKILPFIGFLVNKNMYKMQFLVPENSVLNTLADFKNNQLNVGFSCGIQYRIFQNILITADYQYYKIKNLSLKNSSFDFDIFKTNNTFAERKLNLGISYFISK